MPHNFYCHSIARNVVLHRPDKFMCPPSCAPVVYNIIIIISCSILLLFATIKSIHYDIVYLLIATISMYTCVYV